MGSALPFVSVIIPALNEEQNIRECLVSLLKMDYPPERREILVVDNGSTDGTAKIVQEYPVTLLQEERRGASYARNRGIEACKGEILAFTDTDCVVTNRWLRELVQGFEDGEIGGVEGETLAYLPVTPVEHYMEGTSDFNYQVRISKPFDPFVVTANVAFRREVFHRIGLFDTRFPAAGGEDVDFSWRFLEETDLKLRYNPKAVVFHRHRSTVWGFFSQYMRYGRAGAILQEKYPERLPWTWWEELFAWRDVARWVWPGTRAALNYGLNRDKKKEAHYPYFTLLKKLASRIGFLRGRVGRGYR